MGEPVIEIKNLVKEFRADFWKKKVRILDGVNLQVEQGDVFGFLGPNGAGKTTTLKILMGLVFPTAGEVRLFGKSLNNVDLKRDLGFLPENPYFYEYLNTVEFLSFYADLFALRGKEKMRRIDLLLEMVGMNSYRDLQLRKFSKGMLQRIGIAQALINDPKLVILDEPQTGLDPIGRRDVREILLQLKAEGKTVFFSSHIMHDVEVVCEKVGIIIKGRMHDVGRMDDLLNPKFLYFEVVYRDYHGDVPDNAMDYRQIGSERVLKLPDETSLNQFVNKMLANKGKLVSVTPHKETLEDLFVQQVNRRKTAVGGA